ncbi:MAG: glycosyltransferase [Prevotella sp.]|jgi:1-acyl-sn-glycerol-3-phosphate acyltransferase|nr:glycosyltransferase [Prevotella sp.]MBQ5495970.1 glycosyltransferase [Prevotella sp.]MBQ5549119.1 glycosyltransferase [Prevotella sp.]
MTDHKIHQQQRLNDRGICVVIPTYNNEGTITAVVQATLQECRDVIVVNDGSTDGTRDILHGMEGITLVEYAENRGKGYALKCGFRRALQMGFAYAITLDGDGQHYPDDIALFLKANQQHPGALILGSRQMDGIERSLGSRFANEFSNFWFYVQTGRRLADTQTGYRLYPLKKLHGLELLTSRYEAELELLVQASWHGVEIVPINIKVYYPPLAERVSHFRPIRDFARISVLNTVLCFLAVVYGLPLRLWRWLDCGVRTVYAILFTLFFSLGVFTPMVWLFGRRGLKLWIHRLIYRSMRFLMLRHGIPGTTFTYKISEEVDFNKPAVYICNHQSHLDLPCQLMLTPKMVILTKDWVWNNPLYGLIVREAEFYPVSTGIEQLMPKLKSLVERGYSIALYPEGTRSENCRIGRFHKGAFAIAEQLGLDVVPMFLYGPGRILPKKTYHLRRGPIYMELGRPVTRAELNKMGDLRTQAQAMRRHYIEKYEIIANRIEQNV